MVARPLFATGGEGSGDRWHWGVRQGTWGAGLQGLSWVQSSHVGARIIPPAGLDPGQLRAPGAGGRRMMLAKGSVPVAHSGLCCFPRRRSAELSQPRLEAGRAPAASRASPVLKAPTHPWGLLGILILPVTGRWLSPDRSGSETPARGEAGAESTQVAWAWGAAPTHPCLSHWPPLGSLLLLGGAPGCPLHPYLGVPLRSRSGGFSAS